MRQLHRYESIGGVVVETLQGKAAFDALVDAVAAEEKRRAEATPSHGELKVEETPCWCNTHRRPNPVPAIKLRRPAPRPKVTLGDKVTALRQLDGSARARAEAQFLLDAEPFMRRCASWYRGDDIDDDDLMSTARLAVWSAVVDWDAARAPFDTHARWRIRTELGKLLRGSRIVRGAGKDAGVPFEDSVRVGEEIASDVTARPRPCRVDLVAAETESELSAAEEVEAALGDMPPDAVATVRLLLDGEVVDAKAAAAAKELLGRAVLRRRRGVAATPPIKPGGRHGDSGARVCSGMTGKP